MKLGGHAPKSTYRPLGFQMSPRRLSDGGHRSQGTVGADTVSCTCQRKSGCSPGGELGILFLGSKGRRELLKPMRPLEVSENFGRFPVPGCGERNASDSHRWV